MKIVVNSNTELVKQIRQSIKENNGYCPCKLIKNEDTKCMCKEFLEQDIGFCHCGLYEKVEK